MLTKKKIYLLLGILLVIVLPLSSSVFSGGDVVHAQAEDPLLPTIGETVNLDWVSGENWPVGELVTLTIDDPDTKKSPDYTDSEIVGDDAQANFDYFNGNQISFDFRPGHLVTLTAGDVSLTHEVLDVEVTQVDFGANSVEGYGLPNSELFVDINACGEYISVMTDNDGYWLVYPVCDLKTVNYLFADQFDTPNTRTSFFWSPPQAEEGSISGMVTKQDTGVPIVGMEVAACPYDYEDGMPCYSGLTESDGSYIIQGVPVGTYRVDSGWSGNWVVEYYKNTPFWEEAKPVKIKPVKGENAKDKHFNVTGIDFTLELGGSISGTVTEQDSSIPGTPIIAMEVAACPYDFDAGEYMEGMPCYSGWTETDGSYFIRGVPAGTYRVDSGWEGNWVVELYSEQTDWSLADTVVVIADVNTPDIDFTLELGGSISGTVTEQSTGVAIEGMEVAACPYDYEDGMPCFSGWTEADGSYFIRGVPAGTYRVDSGWEGNWVVEYYSEQINWDLADPVVVSVNINTPDINFTLEMGGSISGIVYDENGPIANMAVDIVDGWFGTCTDENGQYTITGLPLGTYDIIAGRDFCGPHPYAEQVISNVTIDAGAPDVYGYDFSLVMGGSISGTVTPVGGGFIGDNIDVSACFEDGSVCGWTSVQGDGTYMIAGLPAGNYRVHAYQYPEGYWIDEVYKETRDWDAYTPVTVTEGVDIPGVNFTLELGGAITGVVEDGAGNPIAGIWVVAHDYAGDYFVSWAQTDAIGTYRILDLPAGTYRVLIDPQDGWTGQEYSPSPVTVAAEFDTFDIDITLAQDSTISGKVTDEFGNHIPERIDVAACWVTDPSVCFWTIVKEDDTYTIAGLPSGEFTISSYEVPGGHWIGETYPSTITLGVDEDVGGINFTLAPVP